MLNCLQLEAVRVLPAIREEELQLNLRFCCPQVADIAKAVSDAPCGGQIIMTGETLAEISSMQDLAAMVSGSFLCEWRTANCFWAVLASGRLRHDNSCGALVFVPMQVAQRCAGWRHGEALDDPYTPASFGVLSLGSHIIKQPVIDAASEAPDAAPSGEPAKLACRVEFLASHVPGLCCKAVRAFHAAFCFSRLLQSWSWDLRTHVV